MQLWNLIKSGEEAVEDWHQSFEFLMEALLRVTVSSSNIGIVWQSFDVAFELFQFRN